MLMTKLLIVGGVGLSLILVGFYFNHLRHENQEKQEQILLLEAQAQTNANNLKLVVQNLDREAEYRIQAEEALSELNKDVPDDEYNQALPANIQNVVDRFHTSIGIGGR